MQSKQPPPLAMASSSSSSIPHLHFLFLLILLLLQLPIAQQYMNATVGLSLSAIDDNSSWSSPSGEFAFGFRRLNYTDQFLLAIWFNKIPDKTIVWYANGDNPAPRESKVELTVNGLALHNPQGNKIWEAIHNYTRVAYAAMLDTGNLVLVSTRDGNIWESFKEQLADTILPTQILERGGAALYSRLNQINYSKGRFELRLVSDGNLVLNPIARPSEFPYDPYYISNTNESDLVSGYRLVFNDMGNIYILRKNRSIFNLTSANIPPITDYYYRATLDFDGVFTQYAHPRTSNGNQSWSIVWSIPDNICSSFYSELGSGACGFNSYCVLTPDKRPSCECPPEYSFMDPNNKFSGCKPNFPQGCGADDGSKAPEDLFEFIEVPDTNWPTGDYERLEPFSEDGCKTSCLQDCYCAVVVFRPRNGRCWKKKLPLSNGRSKINASGVFFKVRKAIRLTPISGTQTKNQKAMFLVGSMLLGSSIFFNFILLAALLLIVFLVYHKKLKKTNQISSVLETNLHSFTYKELEEATDGFKETLGKGSFGSVYKGVLELSSRNLVAVKKLDKVVQEGEKEFKTEVNAIGQTHHKNLVRLLGFCNEGSHRLLVYEFMSNGTLANFLFGIPRPDWNQRTKFAFDIARGLMYLHEECNTQIIHCDIKPQNILLDDFFTARISDFGLAKMLMCDQTITLTCIRGTRGYVAPEWFKDKPVTAKVDVYSFGVMLLEIICCRKSVEREMREEERAILTDWAYDCYMSGRLDDLVENDEAATSDMKRLQRWVMVAIWCIQEEPSLRPTMKKVIQMLEEVVEVPVPPCCSSFSTVY